MASSSQSFSPWGTGGTTTPTTTNTTTPNNNPMGSPAFGSGGLFSSSKKTMYKHPENPHLSRAAAGAGGSGSGSGLWVRTSNENSASSNATSMPMTNTGGLRQRRPLGEQQQQQLVVTTTKNPAGGFQAPPKSSLSLGSLRKGTSVPIDPDRSMVLGRPSVDDPLRLANNNDNSNNTGCWVKVFGMTTQEQVIRCQDLFGSVGQVVETRNAFVPGRRNWIALKFATALQAEKAKGQSGVSLTPSSADGITIGVCALRDDDPILVLGKHEYQQQHEKSTALVLFDEDATATSKSFLSPPRNINTTTTSSSTLRTDGGITEGDLLLEGRHTSTDGARPKRSCFESFMRYLLSLND